MLGIGIDWAESFHDVALGVPGQGVTEQFRFGHGPAGVRRLVARCLELEPDPAEVRVVLETRHGLLAVARRLAYNRPLGEAVQQWAFCSLQRSAWAREFYDEKIAADDNHHSALRKLGNRWLEVLWHCLHLGALYDEAIHTANRNRARGLAA